MRVSLTSTGTVKLWLVSPVRVNRNGIVEPFLAQPSPLTLTVVEESLGATPARLTDRV